MKRKFVKTIYLLLLLCCVVGLCGCSSCGKNEKSKSEESSSDSESEYVFDDENLTINDKYKGYFQNGGYIELNTTHDIEQIDQFTSDTNNVEYFVQDDDSLCMYSFIAGKIEDVNMGSDKDAVVKALSKYKEIDIDTSSETSYENDAGKWYRYITKDVTTSQFNQNFDFETFIQFDDDLVYIVMIVEDAETTDDYLDILDTLILNKTAYAVYKNEEFFQKVSDTSYQFHLDGYDCTISKDVVEKLTSYQNQGGCETIAYDQYVINVIPSTEKDDIKESVSMIEDDYSDYKEDSFINKDGYKVNYISLTLDSTEPVRHYALANIDTGHGYIELDIMGYDDEIDIESVCSGYDISKQQGE